jgi:transposase
VHTWLKRFNAAGLAALTDTPRSGRPATSTPPQVAEVIATSRTPPEHLGLPFASGTLDRLEAYLHAQKAMAIKRSRIDDLLLAEGLRWRTHETGLGERVDPECAQKRGAWKPSTRPAGREGRDLLGSKGPCIGPELSRPATGAHPPLPPSHWHQRNVPARNR